MPDKTYITHEPHNLDDAASDRHDAPASHVRLKSDNHVTWPTGMASDRFALIGALSFMELAASCHPTIADVAEWLEEFLVKPGFMRRPVRIHEYASGIVFLEGSLARPAQSLVLYRIVRSAQREIFAMLEGFVAEAQDDRFIAYFVASGRVAMVTQHGKSAWVPRPRFSDGLSDIVLALFVADILQHRRTYEERLSVCAQCCRISFRPAAHDKLPCPRHGKAALAALIKAG